VDTFTLLCVTSLPQEEDHVVTQAFTIASERDPKLELVLADTDAPAALFQTADLLVCIGWDPAAAGVIPRAQSLGLPVLAVEGGLASQLIESGRSGFVVPASPLALADSIRWLARRAPVRERLRRGGLLAAGARLAQPA
jgi:glycosyltransferase involved in cell wall biosynthesis